MLVGMPRRAAVVPPTTSPRMLATLAPVRTILRELPRPSPLAGRPGKGLSHPHPVLRRGSRDPELRVGDVPALRHDAAEIAGATRDAIVGRRVAMSPHGPRRRGELDIDRRRVGGQAPRD